jgi:hypothetical protein
MILEIPKEMTLSTSHIDADVWVEHFRNLHSKSDSNFQSNKTDL